MRIKFGPAGLGGAKEAISNLEYYNSIGLKACEIAFTYGVYLKKPDATKICKAAEKLGLQLSIHAPYWINLNSDDKEKIKASEKRILKCLEIGTVLNAIKVVFHPGYYGKLSKEQTYLNIKNKILELQKIRTYKNYSPKLAPETTGKINVFGSIEEIKNLTNETGCSFCIDFAHILARYKSYKFKEVEKYFKKYKEWHIHFSGIEYGPKGEKKHLLTKTLAWKQLLSNLPRTKQITIINESPNPVKDSVKGLNVYNAIYKK